MKSPVAAFFLSLVPGLGHLYIGRFIRAFFYFGGSFAVGILSLIISLINGNDELPLLFGFFLIACIWGINMLDMIVTISNKYNGIFQPKPIYQNINGQMVIMEQPELLDPLEQANRDEQMKILFLSLFPGLAHMYMNFIKRGLSIMLSIIAIFGIAIMISDFMYSPISWMISFIIPVIWIFSIFDARQLVRAKHQEQQVEDHYIFDMLTTKMVVGTKSETALIFSLIPGFGHLVLGYAKQGVQLLLITAGTIMLIQQFHMPFLRYFTILIWAYSFFDTLYILRNQQTKQQTNDGLKEAFRDYKHWIGLGLIAIGVYFIFNLFATTLLEDINKVWYNYYINYRYTVLTALASFVVIFTGIKLMTSSIAENQKRKAKNK